MTPTNNSTQPEHDDCECGQSKGKPLGTFKEFCLCKCHDPNPEMEKGWEKKARERIFNKPVFISDAGQHYLDDVVFPFIRRIESEAVERQKLATINYIMDNLYQKYPEACNLVNELFLKHLDTPTKSNP